MSITKSYFISIDKVTSKMVGYCTHILSEGIIQNIESTEDILVKEMSAEELGALTLEEFFFAKKAVLSGEEFSNWDDKHDGLSCIISENPKNDGSNSPYITMSDGLPNSPYITMSTYGISLNDASVGALDDIGGGIFQLRVPTGITLGSITIHPDGHCDFKPVTFSLSIDTW
jgi:hypothetical protein